MKISAAGVPEVYPNQNIKCTQPTGSSFWHGSTRTTRSSNQRQKLRRSWAVDLALVGGVFIPEPPGSGAVIVKASHEAPSFSLRIVVS